MVKPALHDIIRNVFLFESLEERYIQELVRSCSMVSVSRGSCLFRDRETATAFFALVSGRVKIYKLSADGNEHILAIHDPPALIAEAAIFDRETYPASCQAMLPSTLLKIPRDVFINLVKSSPDVSIRILHAYSRRLRTFVSMLEGVVLHDVKSRLAYYLISNSHPLENRLVCRILVPKKELAANLGTIPETLSRTLRFFKQKKIISEKTSIITIEDYPRLLSHVK